MTGEKGTENENPSILSDLTPSRLQARQLFRVFRALREFG
ncbi:hypothetical protein CKA32_003596 [Geitlerinema sp. FC II]|nr:hypothetical protein CKA32_003596 [Geitlerinema sp. FC II]